jgi:CRP/FNR family transcriptional regulator, cyclic AMP receptor protein
MDAAFLKKVTLFEGMTNEELKIFSTKLKLQKVKVGDCIIREQEINHRLFILYKGSVGISKKMTMIDNEKKKDKTFIVLSEQDHSFFGEIGLLNTSDSATATVIAKTECELFTIDQKEFRKLCVDNPKIGYKVLFGIAVRLSKMVTKTNTDVLKLTTALIYALKN